MSRNSSSSSSSGGIGVLSLLGVLFVGLKLGGLINWSWWWVTAPFWGGFALIFTIAIIIGVLFLLKVLLDGKK